MRHGILLVLFATLPLSGAGPSAVNIQLHDYEDGPPVTATHAFRPSETVFLSFQIAEYKATEDDHIELSYEIAATDPTKRPIDAGKTAKITAELALEDKKKGSQWMPKVRYQVKLPATPAPGVYNIHIHLEDKIANAHQDHDVPFQVESSALAPSETLSIQNFRFLRSDNDRDPLPQGGSYRNGDAVWTRFDITGYKFGKNNAHEVKYGLALKDATGKVLFANPDAATDKNESFYPRTFLPGEFSLNLDKNIKPGDYTLVILLTDAISGETFESANVFHVE